MALWCATAALAERPDPALVAKAQFERQNPGSIVLSATLLDESEGYAIVKVRYRAEKGARVSRDQCFLKQTDTGWLLEGCNADDC